MPEAPHRHSVARATIAAAHLAAFVAIWMAVVLVTGGDPLRWYLTGGAAMHLLLLVALAQLLAGTWLGFRHLEAPLPTSLHFALPVAAVLIGLGASTLGVNHAFDALVAAPPELNLQTLTAALAAGELPQQLGSLIGGLGCASAAVTAAVVAFLNRGNRPVRPLLVIGGLGVVATAAVAVLFHVIYAHDLETSRLAWLATCALGATILLTIAAPGVIELVHREAARAPAVGFSLGVLAALAAVGTVLLQGIAIAAHGRIEALQATGMAPVDMATILIARGARATELGNRMTAAFAIATAVPALTLLWLARPGLRPWFADRLKWALLTFAMVAAAAVVHSRFRSELEGRVQVATADLRPQTPEGLALAGSTTDNRYVSGAGEVVILNGEVAAVLDRVIGPLNDDTTVDRLVELLQPTAMTEVTNPIDLAAHLVTAAALVPADCPEPILEPFALVVDGTRSAREVLRFASSMRARGACRMRLMVRPRALLESPDLIAQRDAMRRELADRGMLAALFEAAANDWHFVFAYLTSVLPTATDEMTPIILRTEGETVRVVVPGTLDHVVEATRRGRVDRDALALELEDLKATFSAERRVYIDQVDDASLQDIVDVLDAAREEVEFEDDTIGTFDKVVFVTKEQLEKAAPDAPEPPATPDP